MTNTLLLPITRAVYRRMLAADAAYEAEVRDWYENGDGRAPEWVTEWQDNGDGTMDARSVNIGGLGYRFPTCRHGASLWTDYDNICGGCEDSTPLVRLARWTAESAIAEWEARTAWMQAAPARSLGTERLSELWIWASEPLTRWTNE